MCKNVEHIQLKPFLIEQQVLMLRMYINQLFAQLFYLHQRCGSIINKCSAFTGCLHFTAQDALLIIFQLVLLKERAHTIR